MVEKVKRMQLKFEYGELLKAQGINKYARDFQAQLLAATRRAMHIFGKEMRDKIRTDVQRNLNVKRPAILKSFVYKVYFQKTNRVPSLHFYSGIKWMGVHAKGGSARRVIIPFAARTGSVKEGLGTIGFRKLLAELASDKNLFFENHGQYTIIWAKNTGTAKRRLAPFRKFTRQKTGQKTIKREERVNIGMIVSAKWTKKINMLDMVEKGLPKLNDEILKQFEIGKKDL